MKLVVSPKQIVALNDVVRATMEQAGGLGSLELQGEVADLVVTSRTYTADSGGTFVQFIGSATSFSSTDRESAAWKSVLRLREEALFQVEPSELAPPASSRRCDGAARN